MPRVNVRRAARITLPAEVRQKLGVFEGNYLNIELMENDLLLQAHGRAGGGIALDR